jgi:hypothetical protein
MHLDLIVNILPIFKWRGQELKAHLSIEVSNGNATHNFFISNNFNCLSRFPFGSASLGEGRSPHCHSYCLFLIYCYVNSLLLS